MKIKQIISALMLVAVAATAAMAQNSVITPYSRFGYGILSDNATSSQRAMGGVGYAMQSGRQTNVMNPASYASIDSLTFLFDMGVDFTTLWSKENGKSQKDYGGGLDYITLQVPIAKRMGASVGILPYASVGYAFGNNIQNGATERNGSGSLNQLYLGFAGNPWKGLSLGFNFAYLFGNVYNQDYVSVSGGSQTLFERQMDVRDWRLDLGIQYRQQLTRRDAVTLGVVYSPKKDLHGNVYGIYYDTSVTNPKPDTVNVGDHKMKGKYSVPETWGVGLSWQRSYKLMAEVDFTYQPWSKAKYGNLAHFENAKLADRYRIAAGVQYTPDYRGGYFKRINYRFGAYYNRDYITVRDNNVRDYGVTLGFGFPVPAFKTIVNLGFEYRHRQAYPNPLLKEDYLNITLGINFNEMWFRKNKIY